MAKKILIVEDNPQNMKLMQMTLRSADYELLEALDGEQAYTVATREHPDLILMDIQLPKMNGLDVTQKLRKNPDFKSTPIIAITAHVMKGDEAGFLAAGCNSYVSKPFNTRELRTLVASMLQ